MRIVVFSAVLTLLGGPGSGFINVVRRVPEVLQQWCFTLLYRKERNWPTPGLYRGICLLFTVIPWLFPGWEDLSDILDVQERHFEQKVQNRAESVKLTEKQEERLSQL